MESSSFSVEVFNLNCKDLITLPTLETEYIYYQGALSLGINAQASSSSPDCVISSYTVNSTSSVVSVHSISGIVAVETAKANSVTTYQVTFQVGTQSIGSSAFKIGVEEAKVIEAKLMVPPQNVYTLEIGQKNIQNLG